MEEIRQAGPGDSRTLARLLYITSKSQLDSSFFEYMFPGPRNELLEKLEWLCLYGDRTAHHYSKCKVVEVDGTVAACLCFHTKADDSAFNWWRTLRQMGISYRELRKLLWRIRLFLRVHPSYPGDALVVGNIATFPEYRRRGLVNLLLEDAKDEGLRRGYRTLKLSVFIGNTPAINAYEKVGFEVEKSYTNSKFERLTGSPGMMRMTLEL